MSVAWEGFPGGASGKDLPANSGDIKRYGFDPWIGKIPEGGHGYPLQYSCLENSMDIGAWQATIHSIAESDMTEVT